MTVTKLDLSGNEIGVIGVKHLSNLLSDNTTITELVSWSLSTSLFNFNNKSI
jgi:hypothetical protein